MTGRPDTGHPFGFYRALIHTDGHVGILSSRKAGNRAVEAQARILAEFGLTTFRLGWLPPDEAAARFAESLGCERCQVRLSCGCDLIQDVLTRRCRHGTRKAIQAAAARCGYFNDVPLPAATLAGLDALAAEIVAGHSRAKREKRR